MINKMQTYKSHKTVKAGFIVAVNYDPNSQQYTVITKDIITKDKILLALSMVGAPCIVNEEWVKKFRPIPGEFLVLYEDGYMSVSPQDKFIKGYIKDDITNNYLDGNGYGIFISNKIVRAMKVGLIEGCRIYDYNDENFFIDVAPGYICNHPLNLPGYLVVYDNEYMSWCPEDSFIRDHKLI